MLNHKMVKWVAAGALALSLPAIGMARHASHVTAAGLPKLLALNPAVTDVKPAPMARSTPHKAKKHARKHLGHRHTKLSATHGRHVAHVKHKSKKVKH